MPRDGSEAADNGIEHGHNIVHGAGEGDTAASSEVDRSSKAVPPPEEEKGEAIEGMNASGGGDSVKGSGKGPLETTVDQEAEK